MRFRMMLSTGEAGTTTDSTGALPEALPSAPARRHPSHPLPIGIPFYRDGSSEYTRSPRRFPSPASVVAHAMLPCWRRPACSPARHRPRVGPLSRHYTSTSLAWSHILNLPCECTALSSIIHLLI